jgi:hypothetical protein
MMRRFGIALVATLTASLAIAGAAQASDTQNYTFTGQTSPDSSTCGGNWANDTFTRVFQVYPEQNVDLSYRVVELFKSGTFVTVQGPSPESCEAGTANTLSANVHGSFHGSETLKVHDPMLGDYSPSGAAAWNGSGGTTGFINAAFPNNTGFDTPDYYFKYTTSNSAACAKKWIDSATGDSGDIATFCN